MSSAVTSLFVGVPSSYAVVASPPYTKKKQKKVSKKIKNSDPSGVTWLRVGAALFGPL